MHYDWEQTAVKKRNVATLNSAHQAKSQCNFVKTERFTWVLLNLVILRDFLGVVTKLKESTFKNNIQINSNVTTRTRVLSTEWPRAWSIIGMAGIQRKADFPRAT